tara:strand:+ start:19742 stop:20302 length:561 start_codon:yes stop_codon:yes gene_type:complete
MSDFWEEFANTYVVDSAIDRVLQGREMGDTRTTSMQDLTDKSRDANALKGPYNAGQRVSFTANIGSVLTYDDVPGDGVEGTIILVKSGGTKVTSHDGLIFVAWDDGKFRPIYAQHLRPGSSNRRMASNIALRVAHFGLVDQFFTHHAAGGDELVHRATKDLWSFRQDDGGYVIERLFDYKGEPLKV